MTLVFRNGRFPLVIALAAVLVSLAGCGAKDDRLPVRPVSGKLMLGPMPTAGAMVVFHPLEKKDDRAVPRGKVEKDGTFQLSTYVAGDGAPVGKYKVTIDWRKGGSLDPNDDGVSLVHARYTKPASTPIEVEITAETAELKTIEISK